MSEIQTAPGASPFDAVRHVDSEGREYWSARELMAHFGYARWSDVRDGIARARAAITNSLGETAAQDHIEADLHMIRAGKGAHRQVDDFRLTRYGAYIWAMNGDPRKAEIAAAQTYFAVKTREAELEPAKNGDDLDVLQGMIDRLREDRQRIVAVEGRQDTTEARVAAIEGRHDWFTALGYAKLHGHPTDRTHLSRVGAKATRIMREEGQEPSKRQDATFGAVNLYPADVLERAFAEVAP
ncbi:hypothetical protein GCM10023224_05700 [Streptomonospora halophila]|uniref:DNA-damage-inducible protein D n=1 Tax=Streptomonospora halophila TaxID=427369 RepID=A0ABP9G658_9ACTN